MREEQVTKSILSWLLRAGWEIVCFDFPQSGTGRLLHPDGTREKTRDAINPDIVAVKDGICLFFENKDRYVPQDYRKQHALIADNHYTAAISQLLRGCRVRQIYYGVGLPDAEYRGGAVTNRELVDFVVGVDADGNARFLFQRW